MKTSQLSRAASVIMIAIASIGRQEITAWAQTATLSPNEAGYQLVPPALVPQFATFWSRQRGVPYPCNPFALNWADIAVDVYALPNGSFLLDDEAVDYEALHKQAKADARLAGSQSMELDSDDPDPPPPESTLRNYAKFMNQAFSLIDTNDAAVNDTNLYYACLSFPDDTNTAATLQIEIYQTNTVLIRANHFDYSAETERDFALLICDKVETPIWKRVDFSNSSDAQDGWLVQGTVPNWKVTDPMYLKISDLNLDYNGFFEAIPYGGPQVLLTGLQPYDVVSNSITLQATITDLSGVTNEQFEVTVDGAPARYSFGTNNTVTIETKYNPNGVLTVYLNAGNNNARVHAPTNSPDNAKVNFSSTAALPRQFLNDTYLAFASDNVSPDVGTNYVLYVIDKAQEIEARIFNPADNQTLASYAGRVPFPATVVIPWNFTLLDGVTPYTNDTYAVHFVAYDPTTLDITNKIDRNGVRTAGGCIVTYEEEDPTLNAGPYLNSQAWSWVSSLAFGYESLYLADFGSLTLYWPFQIGVNRDNPSGVFPDYLTKGNETNWANRVCSYLANSNYSDFGYYMGHANGVGLGGGPRNTTWVKDWIDSGTIKSFVGAAAAFPNWRMRKVALWACYTDSPSWTTGAGTYPIWYDAFGIRPTSAQKANWIHKNVGLFFGGELPQGNITGTLGGTSVEVAVLFDELWISGPNPFPGACDPTYAFSWVFNQIRNICPEINKGLPAWVGFGYLPYSGVYDEEILTNNISHVTR
jgi:hypothetical protein